MLSAGDGNEKLKHTLSLHVAVGSSSGGHIQTAYWGQPLACAKYQSLPEYCLRDCSCQMPKSPNSSSWELSLISYVAEYRRVLGHESLCDLQS